MRELRAGRRLRGLLAATAVAALAFWTFRPDRPRGQSGAERRSIAPGASRGGAQAHAQPLRREGPFRVRKVFDGDTVWLSDGRKVRLLGVDAPEMDDPDPAVRRAARKARAFLRERVEGRDVTLEIEPDPLDRYGRTLAHLLREGRSENGELLRAGYAYADLRSPFARLSEYAALEREARVNREGLWREVPVVHWSEAARHVGRVITTEGEIAASHHSGKACFLNFHPDYLNHLTAVIPASAFDRFPPRPERHYAGRPVRITGRVQGYRERPEIVLDHPARIETE